MKMPGKRMPTAVVKANGRKHLSKQEEADRLAQEVHVDAPEQIVPPRWLAKKHHEEFLEIAGILAELELYAELDRDVLAQYFVCRERWLAADKEAAKAIRDKDEKRAREWGGVQSSYFKQARQCAESMGLSVTSRCRMVLPDGVKQKQEDENPFLTLIRGGAAANG